METKNTWREIFVASILFLVGTIYLVLQIASMSSGTSRSSTIASDVIVLNRSEVLSDIRTFTTILLSFAGGIGLLKAKRFGWVFALPIFIVLLGISSAGWFWMVNSSFDISYFLVPVATLILVTALILLLLKSTRRRLGIGSRDYLITAILVALLLVLYFVLQ